MKPKFRIINSEKAMMWQVKERCYSKGLGFWWDTRGLFYQRRHAVLFKEALILQNDLKKLVVK